MKKIYIQDIREKLKNNFDVKYREIECDNGIIYVIYIGHLCDAKYMSEFIVTPIMDNPGLCNDLETVKKRVISTSSIYEVTSVEDAVKQILSANAVILFSYLNSALYCEAHGFAKRAIDIPITETVIKGPREGFTESLSDNLSAIRRIIVNTNLNIEKLIIGRNSNTVVALLYIDGIAPVKLIDYVRNAILKADSKSKSGYIIYSNTIEEEMKCKGTAFETIGYTEKPDIACSKLSEGSVVVLIEGSPFVITTPYFFVENFQSADDYTLNKVMGNLGRILRWMAFIIATFAPAMYLALVTYHFRLIPTMYLFRMAIFRAGVPVPTALELLYMTFFFQIIREAGVRLPQPIGPTLSIVGALILGDAAVTSGLASQVTVVVVAISSITSYLLPKMYAALFIWDLIFISFSGILGLPGFYMAFVVFVAHMANLTTCGYPYLYPLGTLRTFKFKDIFVRGNLADISNKILTKDDK
jgi:spore germination protein KA